MISTQHLAAPAFATPPGPRHATEKLNRLTGWLPYDEADNLRQAIAAMPECRDFRCTTRRWLAVRIAGGWRTALGLSVHVGVIPGGLALPPCAGHRGTTQYDARDREGGLVRSTCWATARWRSGRRPDLVQRNHAVRWTCRRRRRRSGRARVLAAGRTIGCFQIESPACVSLQMLQAKDLQDVIHGLSLIRPGPPASGMKERFISAPRPEPVIYPHPAAGALAETTA
jgi:hypothetical protein